MGSNRSRVISNLIRRIIRKSIRRNGKTANYLYSGNEYL